jgi:hypothetical protein
MSNTTADSEDLIERYQHKNDLIVDHLLTLPKTSELLRYFLFHGTSALMRIHRHRNRKLIKEGRADEVRHESVRKEEEEWIERTENLEAESTERLFDMLDGLLKAHENSVLTKWMIAGGSLGYATPEMLLEEADSEDRAADGHSKNALFYRQLAKLGRPGVPLAQSVNFDEVDLICASIFSPKEQEQRTRKRRAA